MSRPARLPPKERRPPRHLPASPRARCALMRASAIGGSGNGQPSAISLSGWFSRTSAFQRGTQIIIADIGGHAQHLHAGSGLHPLRNHWNSASEKPKIRYAGQIGFEGIDLAKPTRQWNSRSSNCSSTAAAEREHPPWLAIKPFGCGARQIPEPADLSDIPAAGISTVRERRPISSCHLAIRPLPSWLTGPITACKTRVASPRPRRGHKAAMDNPAAAPWQSGRRSPTPAAHR